jgi:hypothetical protein
MQIRRCQLHRQPVALERDMSDGILAIPVNRAGTPKGDVWRRVGSWLLLGRPLTVKPVTLFRATCPDRSHEKTAKVKLGSVRVRTLTLND